MEYENVSWENEKKTFRRVVNIINNLNPKPKFVIVCGDLVHAFPERNRTIHEKQMNDFTEIIKEIDPSKSQTRGFLEIFFHVLLSSIGTSKGNIQKFL